MTSVRPTFLRVGFATKRELIQSSREVWRATPAEKLRRSSRQKEQLSAWRPDDDHAFGHIE
jgi:hypothetical protein